MRVRLRSRRGPPLQGTVLGIVGIVALVPVAPEIPAQETVRLALTATPGDWLRYHHRSDLVIELPDDLGGTATTRTSITWLDLVDDVSAEGIDYVTTIERITLEAYPPPSEIPDLSGFQGLQFFRRTSRAARTLDVRLSGRTEGAGPVLLEQVQAWFSQLGLPPLPEDPVREGDSWSETVPVPAIVLGLAVDYDVVQERSVRLDEVRLAGRTRVAILSVTTAWESTPEPGGAGGTITSLRGTAIQSVRFDVDRGRFLGSSGTSELQFVLRPEGAAQYVAVSARGRQVSGLTASGGPAP
jgi:hypothetical protein